MLGSNYTYRIPEDISEFEAGTEYEVRHPIEEEWGSLNIIAYMCNSVRQDLKRLIEVKRIRIRVYD